MYGSLILAIVMSNHNTAPNGYIQCVGGLLVLCNLLNVAMAV